MYHIVTVRNITLPAGGVGVGDNIGVVRLEEGDGVVKLTGGDDGVGSTILVITSTETLTGPAPH